MKVKYAQTLSLKRKRMPFTEHFYPRFIKRFGNNRTCPRFIIHCGAFELSLSKVTPIPGITGKVIGISVNKYKIGPVQFKLSRFPKVRQNCLLLYDVYIQYHTITYDIIKYNTLMYDMSLFPYIQLTRTDRRKKSANGRNATR